ncbi:MAG: adenosine deaminase [Clostridia bacterium]|nr:adenosine deaminase [Clostridia bacterium]
MRKEISIDLHLHFDGSLSITNARELAALEGVALPEDDNELKVALTVSPDCKDLGEYLTKFAFPLSLLQSEAAIEQGMYTLCRELDAEGCIYAEIRFAPQLHLDKGLDQKKVVEAAIRGFKRSAIDGGLILCCMRGDDKAALNETTLEIAREYLGKGVVALDLAGNEAGFPTDSFASLFARARELQVPFTIHAGEADCAESVRSALAMGASRIGHGVRSIEDPALVEILAKNHIALELCPISNIQTTVFDDISEYPIRQFLKAGVAVTVNSDNRSVSATTARQEMLLLKNTFALTDEEEKALLHSSVDAAFASEELKKKLHERVEESFS